MKFRDRHHAGDLLGIALKERNYDRSYEVIGLPRGGIPVAYRVAFSLGCPLDLLIVRKLGVPGREELAMGALGPDGHVITNDDITDTLQIPPEDFQRAIEKERRELARRSERYRKGLPPLNLKGKKIIIVDDGIATGASMRAAIASAKNFGPASTTIAVPVASREAVMDLGTLVDEMICLYTPDPFYGVGLWYQNFQQTTDDEVIRLVQRRRQELASRPFPTAI